MCRTTRCTNPHRAVYRASDATLTLYSFACWTWSCEGCRNRLRDRWSEHFSKIIYASPGDWFAALIDQSEWEKVRARLKRRGLKYFAIAQGHLLAVWSPNYFLGSQAVSWQNAISQATAQAGAMTRRPRTSREWARVRTLKEEGPDRGELVAVGVDPDALEDQCLDEGLPVVRTRDAVKASTQNLTASELLGFLARCLDRTTQGFNRAPIPTSKAIAQDWDAGHGIQPGCDPPWPDG